MTLDEAIKHAEEVAKGNEKLAEFYYKEPGRNTALGDSCMDCAAEHYQLVEWLKELKALKAKPCEDCISREDAVELVYKARRMPPIEGVLTDTMSWAIAFVGNASSVEPERKLGKWINVDGSTNTADCSCCGNRGRAWMRYCYMCGSMMEVEV